jgi:hypothetical protein
MPASAKRSSVTRESQVKNVADVAQKKSSSYRVMVSCFVISTDIELIVSSNIGRFPGSI